VGTVGRNDRVHVHGARVAADAPRRNNTVRDRVRDCPDPRHPGDRRRLLSTEPRRREHRRNRVDAVGRERLVRRPLDPSRRSSAPLSGTWYTDDKRRHRNPASDLGRLLPGGDAARVAADGGRGLSRNLRNQGDARVSAGGSPDSGAAADCLRADRHRPGCDPDGTVHLPVRRAIREAHGAPEEEWMREGPRANLGPSSRSRQLLVSTYNYRFSFTSSSRVCAFSCA